MSALKRSVVLACAVGLIALGSPATALTASAAPVPSAAVQVDDPPVPAVAKRKATKIVALSPFRPSGQLKKAWHTSVEPGSVPKGASLDCSDGISPGYALNNGMYTCFPSVVGADACWASPKYTGRVLCLESPWSRSLRPLAVRALPVSTRAPKRPQPLAMELEDGTRWLLKTSGTYPSRKDKLLGIYLCANKKCSSKVTGKDLAILSSGGPGVNRSKPVWTVRVGEVGSYDDDFPAPKRHKVKKAWFVHNNIG